MEILTVASSGAAKPPTTIKVVENGKVKNRPTGDHAALDRQVLEQFLGHLQVGEPSGDNVDPLADLARGAPDLGEVGDGGAWSEGDWDAEDDGSTEEASDGEL